MRVALKIVALSLGFMPAILAAATHPATEESVPTTLPTTEPATQPTSQPPTTQAVEELKSEAAIKKKLAEETTREADSELQKIREKKKRVEREAERTLFSPDAQAKIEQLNLVNLDEAFEQERKTLAELQDNYADELLREAEKHESREARQKEASITYETLNKLTPHERNQKADELEQRAGQHDKQADDLQTKVETQKTHVAAYQKVQTKLAEQIGQLESQPPSKQRDDLLSKLRPLLGQNQQLIVNQRLLAYSIIEQARAEHDIANEYRREAEALRAANRLFWVKHAYILNVARILLVTIGITFLITLLTWLAGQLSATVARRFKRETAEPTVKRVRTLIYFARSIAKLLVWIFALVTILAEFGISPGQSAGALGVIGLVLAGMFQQLVVDFVKGIDIAIGGHYFVGDFIQVGDKAGHVLDIRVKYTVLRTPSGQVLNVPNSECIPSRRFIAGYVDNYVDFPLANEADLERAKQVLASVGRMLNERVEAVKQEPEFIKMFHHDSAVFIRMRARVLPTCDWVITDHYIPMVKRQFQADNIVLANEPTFFFINNVATFRQLFSRQLSEQDIARVAAEETQPTTARPDRPDPNATSSEQETEGEK